MVSEYLKKNTAKYHDAAEKLFRSDKIFTKTFTLQDYRKIILANYLMLLNAEEQIFTAFSEEISRELKLEQRKKLPLLEKDIHSLSLENQMPSHSFAIRNQNEAFGMLYVIEGSTLGGNVMAKQLSKTEGFNGISFHFFGCYQENTGMMWKSFKEILDREVPEEHYREVLAGAEKMYRFLLNIS